MGTCARQRGTRSFRIQLVWPEAPPARGLVQAFQAQRARLEALLRARLERLTLRTGTTLPELLGLLQAVAVLYLLFCLGILLGVPVAMDFLKPGQFWLTPERLVWKAMFGQAVEVRLASIPPGGISSPRRHRLHVEGDRKLTLEELPQARELAALLERHLPEAAAPLRAGGAAMLGAGGTSRGTRPSG